MKKLLAVLCAGALNASPVVAFDKCMDLVASNTVAGDTCEGGGAAPLNSGLRDFGEFVGGLAGAAAGASVGSLTGTPAGTAAGVYIGKEAGEALGQNLPEALDAMDEANEVHREVTGESIIAPGPKY